MKISEIKRLVDTYSTEQLTEAIQHYYDTKEYPFPVEGSDDGERYTHLYGSRWVINYMAEHGADQRTAIRAYANLIRL